MAIDEKAIVGAMRTDAEKGFRLLMQSYKEPVYWHIRRLVVSYDDAQDVAQETFLKIYRSFSQYTDSGTLTAWIYKIATNEALRLIGKKAQEAHAVLPSQMLDEGFADEYVDYDDAMGVIFQRAILSLPDKQRIVFNLRYYDELTYGEIAEIVGSTAVNVKANYHLAKERIVKYIKAND